MFFVKLSYMMVLVILKSSYLILVLPDVIDCLGLGVGFGFTCKNLLTSLHVSTTQILYVSD